MSISRLAYSDGGIFEKEVSRIFGSRMYAASIYDLSAINDYRSFLVGNRAITIRKTSSGIRAFNNVCLHRSALIDTPGTGNRAFRCNYHGWSYDDDGSLRHAPLANKDAICDQNLAQYPLAELNGLYFIGHRTSPDVSEVALAFKKTGISTLAEPFCRGVLEHDCNWKLLVENVLEGYHLSYVHGETFVPAGFTSTGAFHYERNGGASWSSIVPKPANDRSQSFRRLSPDSGHFYNHAFVFPNFFLANSNGLVGFHSSLQPISATTTRLEWCLFELPALTALANPIREHFRKDAIAFANATLLEDKVLVESCQLGMTRSEIGYQLQANEGRIAHFHSMYRDVMGEV